MLTKNKTYVRTNRGWQPSKGFTGWMTPYHLYALVLINAEGLRYCEVEFSF